MKDVLAKTVVLKNDSEHLHSLNPIYADMTENVPVGEDGGGEMMNSYL